MKKLVLAAIMVFAGLTVSAQSITLEEAVARIDALEKLTQQQTNQINQLNVEFQKLKDKHLQLRDNLNLKDVKSREKIGDMVYKVVKVTGDPVTRDVHVEIIAENKGDVDVKQYYHSDNEIIDEKESGYNSKERHKFVIEGIANNLYCESIIFHPNTPLKIDLNIKGYKKDANYIKYLKIDAHSNSNPTPVVFQNLEITWEEE